MANVIEDLTTIRDYIRHGVSKFNKTNLSYGHGTDNAFDEAIYLVMEILDLPIEALDFFLDAKLSEGEREQIIEIIDRRIKTRKPAPYLTNKIFVQDYCFYVDERVNIPRSLLSELISSDLIGGKEFNLIDDPKDIKSVLDICCGSAFLSIIAANKFTNAKIDAIDISKDALEVAKINVKDYGMEDRVTLLEGDLFKPVANKKYDLILINAPYLSSEDIAKMPAEYAHEPKRAIESGADGLKLIKRIINSAADHLTENGMLLCDIGTARQNLEEAYPHLDFMWFDMEDSKNNAFWLTYEELLF